MYVRVYVYIYIYAYICVCFRNQRQKITKAISFGKRPGTEDVCLADRLHRGRTGLRGAVLGVYHRGRPGNPAPGALGLGISCHQMLAI